MAHTCPTCYETCYCMGDYSETISGQPAYCKHCTEYDHESNELDTDDLTTYGDYEEI